MFNIKNEKLLISKENAQNEIWDLIFYYTNNKYLKSYGFTDKPIDHIQYLRDQSYEFFLSEKYISLKTSPLLKFYGCMNLVKSLILYKKIKKGIESLDQKHGLKFIIEKKDFLKNILNNCKIKIETSGTFIELLELSHSNFIDTYKNQEITLYQLINRYVDIYDFLDYKKHILPIDSYKIIENPPKKDNSVTIGIDNNKKYTLEIELYGGDKQENFDEYKHNYPDHNLNNFTISTIRIQFFSDNGLFSGNNPNCLPIRFFFDNFTESHFIDIHTNYEDQSYLITPINVNGHNLLFTQIEIQYMISFMFSNLTRYYPDKWKKMIDNEIFWSVRKSLDYISRSFPNNILNEFIGKNCIIFTPGILKRDFSNE